jgi:glycosyltransferase involved in cell wall biosynthesis
MIVVTLVKNSEKTIAKTIRSLESQTQKISLWLVIDEHSNDKTINIIKKSNLKKKIISVKTNGIFPAYNVAINILKKKKISDVIFFLHSDDLIYSKHTLKNVQDIFTKYNNDCLFGDIVFFRKNHFKYFRVWRAGFEKKQIQIYKNIYLINLFNRLDFKFGWSFPHTSFFLHSKVIKKIPKYRVDLKSSADYGWSVDMLLKNSFKLLYFNNFIVRMKVGGNSTKITNLLKNIISDFLIIKGIFYRNIFDLPFCLLILVSKKIIKVQQFFFKPH